MRKLITCLMIAICTWFTLNHVSAYDMFVNTYALNVRSQPNWLSRIVDVVYKWEKVTGVEDSKKGWKKIVTSTGKIGYVYSTYLTDKWIWTAVIENSSKIGVVSWDNYKVSVFRANVRSLNYLDKVVAILNKWDLVTVIWDPYKKVWLKVKILTASKSHYVGREWYVFKTLLEPTSWKVEKKIEVNKEVEKVKEQVKDLEEEDTISSTTDDWTQDIDLDSLFDFDEEDVEAETTTWDVDGEEWTVSDWWEESVVDTEVEEDVEEDDVDVDSILWDLF